MGKGRQVGIVGRAKTGPKIAHAHKGNRHEEPAPPRYAWNFSGRCWMWRWWRLLVWRRGRHTAAIDHGDFRGGATCNVATGRYGKYGGHGVERHGEQGRELELRTIVGVRHV
jgi:hypothetical protein